MATEIERKFLITGDKWKQGVKGEYYSQGYIPAQDASIRIRLTDSKAFLTIKSSNRGISRSEFEYNIPKADAKEMLSLFCQKPYIEKIRYKVTFANKVWDVDEFLGENEGLLMAEVELNSVDEKIELPSWVTKEVTGDERYFNQYLLHHPYKNW